MDDYNSNSRVNKYEKRRKNTKAITWLVILGSGLLVLLLMIFMFGGGDKKEVQDDQNTENIIENSEENEDNSEQTSENEHNNNDEADNVDDRTASNETAEENGEDTNNQDEENEENFTTEDSDDENVISAFSRNWDPIGTEQSEPHVVQYDKGTQDRLEMEEAVRLATGLDDMIVWWLGNGGDQKVIATVTSRDQTENYRVYISWITEQGWQPTKVEVLKVNDKQ